MHEQNLCNKQIGATASVDEDPDSYFADAAIFAQMYGQTLSMTSLPSPPTSNKQIVVPALVDADSDSSSLADAAIYAKLHERNSTRTSLQPLSSSNNNKRRVVPVSVDDDPDSSHADAAIYDERNSGKTSLQPRSSGNKQSVVPVSLDEDTESSLADAAIFAQMYGQNLSMGSLPSPPNSNRRIVVPASVDEEPDFYLADLPPNSNRRSPVEDGLNFATLDAPNSKKSYEPRRKRTSVEDEEMFAALYGESSNKAWRRNMQNEVPAPVVQNSDSSLADAATNKAWRRNKQSEVPTPPNSNKGLPVADEPMFATLDAPNSKKSYEPPRRFTSAEDEEMFATLYGESSNNKAWRRNMQSEVPAPVVQNRDSSLADAATNKAWRRNMQSEVPAPVVQNRDSSSLADAATFSKMYEQNSNKTSLPSRPSSKKRSSVEDEELFAKMYGEISNKAWRRNKQSEVPAPPNSNKGLPVADEPMFASLDAPNSKKSSEPPRRFTSTEDEEMFATLYGGSSNKAWRRNKQSEVPAPPNSNKGLPVADEPMFASLDAPNSKKSSEPPRRFTSTEDEEMFVLLYGEGSSNASSPPPPSSNKQSLVPIAVDEDSDSSLADAAIFAKMYKQSSTKTSVQPPPSSSKRSPVEDGPIFAAWDAPNSKKSSAPRRKRTSVEDEEMFAALYGKNSSKASSPAPPPPPSSNKQTGVTASVVEENESSEELTKSSSKDSSVETSANEQTKPSSHGTARRAAGVKSALSIPPKPPFGDDQSSLVQKPLKKSAPIIPRLPSLDAYDDDSDSESSLITPNATRMRSRERSYTREVSDDSIPSRVRSEHVEEKTSKNQFSTGGFTFGALSPHFTKKKGIKLGKFPNIKKGFQSDPHDDDPQQGPSQHQQGWKRGFASHNSNVREVPALQRPPPRRGLVHQESELALVAPAGQRRNRRGSALLGLGGLGKQKKQDTDLPPTEEELEMMKEYEKKHGLSSSDRVSERENTRKQSKTPRTPVRKQRTRRMSAFGRMPQSMHQQAPPPPLRSPVPKGRSRRLSLFGNQPQSTQQQAQPPPLRSPVPRGRTRRLSMFGNKPQNTHSTQQESHVFRQDSFKHRQHSDRQLEDSPLRQKGRRNRRGSVFDVLAGRQKKDSDLPPTQEEMEMMREYDMKHGAYSSSSNRSIDINPMMSPPPGIRNRIRRGSVSSGLLQTVLSPMGMRKKVGSLDNYKPSSQRSLMSPHQSPRRKPLARRGSIQAGLPGGPPLPKQSDMTMPRIDSVGSILDDISLSSESVESGEMFAVPKKFDDELMEDLEGSYDKITELRGGQLEKRHAAVRMLIDVDEENDVAFVGHRNTMVKRGQKALLSIEDLAKNDDELFDFLNQVAKEDGEMQWMKETLEGNIYSLVYTAKWRSAAFWGALFVATFQVAMPGFAILDLIDFQNPSNPFQAPNNVSLQVRVIGAMTLLFAVAKFWDFMAALEKLMKGPPPRWEDTPPGATKVKFYLANIMRATMGLIFILTIFTLIVQATNVVSMFLNFAAMEFITKVDEIIFITAKRGYFTNNIKRACDDVTNVLVVRRKGGRTMRRIMLAAAGATVTVLYFQIAIQQQTGAFDCGRLEVQFGDGFNSALPLFSGIYTFDSHYQDGRPVYWDERRRAAFRYCGNSDGGYYSFEEGGHYVFSYISEDSGIASIDEMCSNYIVQSQDTKGFSILDHPRNTWVTRRRLADTIQHPVDYFHLSCVDCDPKTCNGVCENGVCKCLEGQYGPDCQFTDPPCENIDIDSRTKRFRKAGSVYSSEFSMLRKSDDLPALSYGRPIYTDSWSERGSTDPLVLMNFGRRYFLFRMSVNQMNVTTLGDYLHKVHPYYDWLQSKYVLNRTILVSNVLEDGPSEAVQVFRPDFGSGPIDFGSSYDSITPLDLSWSRVDTSILNSITYYDYLKRTSSVDTVLICSKCSDSSPCFGNSKCTEQGTCDCQFTLAGRLCEVDCFDEPESEVCSNCFRDPSGEGCLQCHKDLNAPDCPWVLGSEPSETNTGTTNTTLTNTVFTNSTIDRTNADTTILTLTNTTSANTASTNSTTIYETNTEITLQPSPVPSRSPSDQPSNRPTRQP